MAAGSFRWLGGPLPRQYRTPSPPIEFHEPISPIAPTPAAKILPSPSLQQCTNPNHHHTSFYKDYRQHSSILERVGAKRGGLETFASIALAADEAPQRDSVNVHQEHSAKPFPSSTKCYQREKHSEAAFRNPPFSGVAASPADVGRQTTLDTRRLEAELLLNFSREACFAIPKASPTLRRPSTSQTHPSNYQLSPQASFSTPPQPLFVFAQDQRPEDAFQNSPGKHAPKPPALDPMALAPRSLHLLDKYSSRTVAPDRFEIASPARQAVGPEKGIGLGLDLEQSGNWQISDLAEAINSKISRLSQDNKQEEQSHTHLTPPAPLNNELKNHVSEPVFVEHLVSDLPVKLTEYTVPESSSRIVPSSPKPILKEMGSGVQKSKQVDSPLICASCNFSRNVLPGETEADATSWISCDGCRKWFHFACAGFRSEREVRNVDKYRCKACKPIHGATTYVRKSARAHSAIDYAGLNEGIIKTSDEDPEHHYVKDFKNGKRFTPETFARMRPELVTADFFSRGDGMKEPILIPAAFNPRPRPIPHIDIPSDIEDEEAELANSEILHERSALDSWLPEQFEYEIVQDDGQDALDMVIPQDLTVRKVMELYGAEEKIDVIDVKSQNGEDKKWTMKRWVDYYESKGDKVVRNVISLEVSQSKLGLLIRRPKVVRDLDLQDAVWPADLVAKGEFPKVQFYCLMSVADCYTDFHIDFGGSSVYYHILKGKKTFFFIPPHEKHLKKYEEWCNSPAQNWTFLGDQTKECYRVDLEAGDTMLIPAGWIHAVWTPEDSLVIGGNFLTPLHYPLQIRVTQIEKATNVARKFRYPHFQKVLWYSAFKYLDEDPLPQSVVELLTSGQVFPRPPLSVNEYEAWGDASPSGTENYQARYYGKAELDGLPELCRYLLRTALIATGNLTEGISAETRNAVKRSIPKAQGHGEPLEAIKKFALWCTWKRGNETIPYWAYPDYVPEGGAAEQTEKKMSIKARRILDREAAYQAFKIAPDRQSTRARQQPQNFLAEIAVNQNSTQNSKGNTPAPNPESPPDLKRKPEELTPNGRSTEDGSPQTKKQRTLSGSKTGPARRPACESCRKSRRACKHRDDPLLASSKPEVAHGSITVNSSPTKSTVKNAEASSPHGSSDGKTLSMLHVEIVKPNPPVAQLEDGEAQDVNPGNQIDRSSITPQSKLHGRTKACKDCRKSKVSTTYIIWLESC